MSTKKNVGMFFLGFFSSLVVFGGAVAITMAVVTPKTVTSWTGAEADAVVTEEYQNKNVYQLISSFVSGETKVDNLGCISKITPIIDQKLEELNSVLNENIGFEFDLDELYTIDWASLGEYIMTSFKEDLTLAGAAKIDPETETNQTLLYLAYETNEDGTPNYDKPRSIMDIVGNIDTLIQDAHLSDLIQDDGSSQVLSALLEKDPKVSEIGTTLDNMTLGELIEIDETSPTILQSMEDWKICDIETNFDTITFGDVFSTEEVEGNRFLQSIPADTLISDLGDAINNIKVIDAFADQIWPLGKPTEESQYINKMDSTWKYLLLDDGESSTNYLTYTIGSDMGTLITNMKANMSTASINQLIDDGFATVEQSIREHFLAQASMAENTTEEFTHPTGAAYGDLTVTQFITRLSWFMDKVGV